MARENINREVLWNHWNGKGSAKENRCHVPRAHSRGLWIKCITYLRSLSTKWKLEGGRKEEVVWES